MNAKKVWTIVLIVACAAGLTGCCISPNPAKPKAMAVAPPPAAAKGLALRPRWGGRGRNDPAGW